ncbi:hypothetical protein GGH13_008664 [Coemansia sp. S155-1]|nr:hypothetical protein GGH13_008664 [Coemansia sp. S155-1]
MLIFLDIPSRRTLSFNVCDTRPLEDLTAQASTVLGHNIAESQTTYITGRHGLCAAEALEQPTPWMCLRGRVLGGKGGFGSTLRSQGSKSNGPANYDNCRDLYGRRLKTLKEAKTIVDKLEADEQAKEAATERRRKKIADGLKESTPKKYLFDDVEYTRNCEEIVESTRLATRRALKKRKDEEESSSSSSAPASCVVPLIPLFDGDMSDSSSSGNSDSEEEKEESKSGDSDKESHAPSDSQNNSESSASSESAEHVAESAKARGKRRRRQPTP